jgi:hypothetical protein
VTSTRHVLAETVFGIATVDADSGELVALEGGEPLPRPSVAGLGLPRLVAADRYGSRVVAALDLRPPLAVSDDAGVTWRQAGAGIPPVVAVAIAPDHPDMMAAVTATRIYVSHDGGRFWHSLPLELEGIVAVALEAT